MVMGCSRCTRLSHGPAHAHVLSRLLGLDDPWLVLPSPYPRSRTLAPRLHTCTLAPVSPWWFAAAHRWQ